jgi:hypothetical protein
MADLSTMMIIAAADDAYDDHADHPS